ncbi:Hypothetical protein PBC10988_6280 [Planctomycetales bacterium 10988]|nr:Hypothetical protein PBC10988_6280 [Planctomycetales bacterium 10988]
MSEELWNSIREHLESGDFQQAEQLARSILATAPTDPLGSCYLATALWKQGNPSEAITILKAILDKKQDFADAWHLLGLVEASNGDIETAATRWQQCLTLDPNHFESHLFLGNYFQSQNDFQQAETHFRKLIQISPQSSVAPFNLGNSYFHQRKINDAIEAYRASLQLDPSHPDAWNNLGNALQDSQRIEEAIESFQQAIQSDPSRPAFRYNLGNALLKLDRFEEAKNAFDISLHIDPQFLPGLRGLAGVLQEQGYPEEAESYFQKVLLIDPQNIHALNGMGMARHRRGLLDDAEDFYQKALAISTDFPEAHRNYSLLLLARGNYEQGWEEYRWRWKCTDLQRPKLPGKEWHGEDLQDKKILVHTEQGSGDILQFARFLPLLKEQGARIFLMAPPALVPLLRTLSVVEEFIQIDAPLPEYDYFSALLDLPAALNTTLQSIPASFPYLHAEAERVTRWKEWLESNWELKGFRIGIAWRGSKGNWGDRFRSLPLELFAPIAAIPGVRLLSLQKGEGLEQLHRLGGKFRVKSLHDRLDPPSEGAFLDTAALMQSLDLIVTCDTSIVHLAGALGKPVWLLLPTFSDWRWMMDREDSPWYPHARLFRQKNFGDWEPVISRVVQGIRKEVARQYRPRNPLGELAGWKVLAKRTANASSGSQKTSSENPSPAENQNDAQSSPWQGQLESDWLIKSTPGDIIDRLTIQLLKYENSRHDGQRKILYLQMLPLYRVFQRQTSEITEPVYQNHFLRCIHDLYIVNRQLWNTEDDIRERERRQDFGAEFIALARSVYRDNDQRSRLKKEIDQLFPNALAEQKIFTSAASSSMPTKQGKDSPENPIPPEGWRLHLGCGSKKMFGYVNVDRVVNDPLHPPDLLWDLEQFPWPWPSQSVQEIVMNHVLEHLGQRTETYLQIFQEMYRICRANARIVIRVPHPRHDFYLSDPTHVRPITELGLQLFSLEKNRLWQQQGASNTPLAMQLGVDFAIEETKYTPSQLWFQLHPEQPVDQSKLLSESQLMNNLIEQIDFVLRVRK